MGNDESHRGFETHCLGNISQPGIVLLYSFWVFLYWIRFLIARVKLYEALIALVNSDPDVSGLDVKKTDIIAAEQKVEGYKTIIQRTAAEIIGLTAYALGDVANTGDFNSAASGRNPGQKFQEINVIAAMQLVIPLKALQKSPYPTITRRSNRPGDIKHWRWFSKAAIEICVIHPRND